MSFWGELKRRNVFKVGAAYLIAAWLILQVASITFPALSFPGWALPLVTVFLIIGFIVAIILAWAYEVTPDGVKLTKKVPLADSITHVTGRKLNYVLGFVIVAAVAYILFDNFYLDRRALEIESPPTIAEHTAPDMDVEEAQKTIAVLPFADLSPEKDQEYFVDGLSEELLNSLAQIPDLGVTARTSSFSFKGTSKTVQEIASVLGVENILEGSVRKAGDSLRITAQLIRAKDGLHIWSKTYDRKLEDIFEVQENIATVVADELKVTLGLNKTVRQLGGTDNVEAYEQYLVAKGLRDKTIAGGYNEEDFFRALDLVDAAIALDPKFALPWVLKSDLNQIASIFLSSGDQASDFIDVALLSSQRAIELEPDLAAGYYQLGYMKASTRDYIGAETAFRHALDLEAGRWSNFRAGSFYIVVGNFEKAKEILEEILSNDPLNQTARMSYIGNLADLGDIAGAEREFEHGRKLFGDMWQGVDPIVPIRLGADDSLSKENIPVIPSVTIHNKVREYLKSPGEGLEELRLFFEDETNLTSINLMFIACWAAYFGDSELAMDAVEAGGDYLTWMPVMHEVRQLPRFKEYLREIGLVDYWEQFGWPDLCHPTDDGDFVCD